VIRMSRFLECCIHSREEEKQSLTAREARCRNGERSYRREARTHPPYEMAGAIDRRKRWPVEWQKRGAEETRSRAALLHPIVMLAKIARYIDGMVEADQEQLATLQEAGTKPYILDDYTVNHIKHAFITQHEDFWVFLGATAKLPGSTTHRETSRRGRSPAEPDGSPSPNQQWRARPGRGVKQRRG
jgi:hypothetical protein